jgi:hypothetical protein
MPDANVVHHERLGSSESTRLRQQLSRRECGFVCCTARAYKGPQHDQQTNNNIVYLTYFTSGHTHALHFTRERPFPACLFIAAALQVPQGLHPCSKAHLIHYAA